jgi:hypothetical protein
MATGYFQPVTRAELSEAFKREICQRPDRDAARGGADRRRAVQTDARRALRLRHHGEVPARIRVRVVARPAWTSRRSRTRD